MVGKFGDVLVGVSVWVVSGRFAWVVVGVLIG